VLTLDALSLDDAFNLVHAGSLDEAALATEEEDLRRRAAVRTVAASDSAQPRARLAQGYPRRLADLVDELSQTPARLNRRAK